MNFVDFCAGIGGFRIGLEEIGMKCVFSCDIDEKCEETYKENFGSRFDAKDIGDVQSKFIPKFDILCAGFPCQPFSIAGKREGFLDHRSNVFEHIIRLVADTTPPIIFLENVKHILHHQNGKTFQIIQQKLKEQGYYVKYNILNCKNFGIPQSRERVYILAFNSKQIFERFTFPTGSNNIVPVKEVLESGNIEHAVSEKWLEYIELYSGRKTIDQMSFNVPKTRTSLEKPLVNGNLNDYILQMRSSGIRAIPISKPLPTFAVSVSGGGAMIPVYVREKRHLNLIEIKRIMGFRDSFTFPVARTHAIKQLANAVCPPVITAIATNLLKAADNFSSQVKTSKQQNKPAQLSLLVD